MGDLISEEFLGLRFRGRLVYLRGGGGGGGGKDYIGFEIS